ncbi:hypothetical protein CMI40_00665 [Candidatus Pacearchaeota archaeon]|jgi:hypothetical protein|nr:hypothetical protein [Candidatus Pacearchaeota archaeon]|tara:strand:- start:6591 stop:7079 length:489 start_codon:yes stop_codon:yes gene_type:complete
MTKKESELDNLKKEYKKIQKEYDLPSFEKLNEDFQIEKIAEVETDYLLREIKRFIADKFSNYLRFVEAILHPVNTPMFIFSVIKSIEIQEKDKLVDIYKKLAKNEVRLIELDIDFSIKNDAEFIKDSYKLWQGIKKDMLSIINKIKKNWDNKFEVNNKGYFG